MAEVKSVPRGSVPRGAVTCADRRLTAVTAAAAGGAVSSTHPPGSKQTIVFNLNILFKHPKKIPIFGDGLLGLKDE